MEIGGSNTFGSREQSVNINIGSTSTLAWDIWDLSNSASRMDWTTTSTTTTTGSTPFYAAEEGLTPGSRWNGPGSGHDPLVPRGYGDQGVVLQGAGQGLHLQQHHQSLYNSTGDGTHLHPDPHLVCLKLGKRHYFEDASTAAASGAVGPMGERQVAGFPIGIKRGKALYGGGGVAGTSTLPATVPRCQVEGCHVALVNAKDYHRRHKVCEMHSKAPKVVVLGLEQRFCQQCSR